MTEQHKHCPTCGAPIPMSERFCSPKCEQAVTVYRKKVARTKTILYIMVVIFLLIAAYYFLKGVLF